MVDNASREFEIKLELDADELEGFRHSLSDRIGDHGVISGQFLKSTYFDTPDHRLWAAGISLRIREKGGTRIQTVKLGTQVAGGISNPVEIESAVGENTPQFAAIGNSKIRKRMDKAMRGGQLQPIFVTEIERTSVMLSHDGGQAELALDSGQIVSGEKLEPVCEAELELVSGNVDTFLMLASRLFAEIPIRFGRSGKAERGFRMAKGEQAPLLVPKNDWSVEIGPGMNNGAAFAAICRSVTGQILHNRGALLVNDDAECAHQLRIGLRRLRTALRIFRADVDSADLRTLDTSVRALGRIVGQTRDSDVILNDIAKPVLARLAGSETAAALMEFLEKRAVAERKAVRRELRQLSWNGVLLQLAVLPYGAGWKPGENDAPVKEHSRGILDKCWRNVEKRARKLDKLNDEERHRLRKDLKTLRYACEFFSPVYPPANCRRFIRTLKEMQDVFGYLNDVVLARKLPEMIANGAHGGSALHEAAGFVTGWHSAIAERQWEHAKERWKLLRKQRKFWT